MIGNKDLGFTIKKAARAAFFNFLGMLVSNSNNRKGSLWKKAPD
jgi:hypothetical protein